MLSRSFRITFAIASLVSATAQSGNGMVKSFQLKVIPLQLRRHGAGHR